MKIVFYLFTFFCLSSCKGQNTENLKIDASKVKSINIINKVDCSFNKLVKQEVTIGDKDQIQKLVDAFSYMQPIQDRGSVNMKVSHGFFEISFNEDNISHYYTIHYTVYNGVVIWSNDGGKLFKNDRLEIAVYKQFVE